MSSLNCLDELAELAEANLELLLSFLPEDKTVKDWEEHPKLKSIMETPVGYAVVVLSAAAGGLFKMTDLPYLKQEVCKGCGNVNYVAVCPYCRTHRG